MILAPMSIWSQFYNTAEPEEAIEEFSRDGLENIELSSEHIEALLRRRGSPEQTGRDFAKFCRSRGVSVAQAHLVFPSDIVTDRSVAESIPRQLCILRELGVRAAVLHGDPMNGVDISYTEKLERNIAALKALAPSIAPYGISVCLENLQGIFRTVDELIYVINSVNSPVFGICLDTGHLNLTAPGTQVEFIRRAGKLLRALHVADNDGTRDQHLAPFGMGNIDFFEIVGALREIGYDGVFNYEIGGDSGKCPVPVKHYKYLGIKAGYEHLWGLI